MGSFRNSPHGYICRVAWQCGCGGGEPEQKTKELLGDRDRMQYFMVAYVGESFTAAGMLTVMRHVTGVCAAVHCQCAALREALAAARNVASIRTLIGMESVVSQ